MNIWVGALRHLQTWRFWLALVRLLPIVTIISSWDLDHELLGLITQTWKLSRLCLWRSLNTRVSFVLKSKEAWGADRAMGQCGPRWDDVTQGLKANFVEGKLWLESAQGHICIRRRSWIQPSSGKVCRALGHPGRLGLPFQRPSVPKDSHTWLPCTPACQGR